jgi:hypothetical protein
MDRDRLSMAIFATSRRETPLDPLLLLLLAGSAMEGDVSTTNTTIILDQYLAYCLAF